MSFSRPSRSSNSRIRIRPPSEVTRDPWKSTFNEALNESWNGWFCFSPAASVDRRVSKVSYMVLALIGHLWSQSKWLRACITTCAIEDDISATLARFQNTSPPFKVKSLRRSSAIGDELSFCSPSGEPGDRLLGSPQP